jgi:trk system potassium uptake protein TrkH
MVNFKLVFRFLGVLLLIEGFFILLCIPVSLIYREGLLLPVGTSGLISLITGGLLMLFTKKADKNLQTRDGFLIVTIGWLFFSLLGAVPFVLTGAIPSFTDAFFETVSGFTTTGASILDDIESLPHSMLWWRSIIQWLGGMGIIVMSLAIFPLLGIGGLQLFDAEAPGPVVDKLHPRIKETAQRLWIIYIIFTIAEAILLLMGGMNLFDSICHSFTTMATGGFSTKQSSIAHWDSPFIQYVITVFMFLAGINFTMSYFALHLNFKKVIQNEEFRYYTGILVIISIVAGFTLFHNHCYKLGESLRHGTFQAVSIMTTTGFVTADYVKWGPFLNLILLMLMLIGGSAGSTAGGMKVIRVLIYIKNSFTELKRLIHPNAVIPVKFNKTGISPEVLNNVFAFISFYFLVLAIGVVFLAALGYDLGSSYSAAATAIGNVGPGIGAFGPTENFNHLPVIGKWFLSFLMIAGRLELFTVLILFSPGFWRK